MTSGFYSIDTKKNRPHECGLVIELSCGCSGGSADRFRNLTSIIIVTVLRHLAFAHANFYRVAVARFRATIVEMHICVVHRS